VAIVQVSRITQRKGLEVDLPQPLAGAEFGWAVDTRQLYIGNGTLAEGAPVVGNTEVLTEFSNILDYANQYTYKGEAGGYTVQTGTTSGNPVTQSLQSRLDSYAVVTDFGAKGDGVTDDTAAINRALYQIYCRDTNPSVRRSLFFPAGRYIVTDTILIPPYAKLYGDGTNSSIIDLNIQEWNQLSSYATGVLVVVTSGSGPYTYAYYRSNFAVPAGTALGDLAPNGDPYWDNTATLPGYIGRTTDSLQQTDAQIQTNGALPPGNVEVSSMSFETNRTTDGFLFEQANSCYFSAVCVSGPLTLTDLVNAGDDVSAVRFASTLANPCSQITWNQGGFSGFTYGVSTDQTVYGITINNNAFDVLYQGVLLDTNPNGVQILNNVFDNVYIQGIEFRDCSLNASGYNVFYDVGNHFNGNTLAASSIILFNSADNVSVGDMFQRTQPQSLLYPRIELYTSSTQTIPASIAITNGQKIELGSYTRNSGLTAILTAGATNGTLFTVIVGDYPTGIRGFQMNYTITRGTASRMGTMTVVSIPDDSTGEFNWTDDYSQSTDTNITLTPSDTATTVGGTITMYYANGDGQDGKIYYSITSLG
jgi:hypothetical protein